MAVRRLNEPVPTPVRAEQVVDGGLRPVQVFNPRARRWLRVEHVLDSWHVDDRWWTTDPVRRAYFACQTEDGGAITLYWDAQEQAWYAQR
jgi:hypothetical protein